MNKAEAIEAIRRLIKDGLDGKDYLDATINFIEPTVDEAWEVIKKEYDIETAEYLKADLEKLVKYESLNLKISNILKIDLEELVEHAIVNGMYKTIDGKVGKLLGVANLNTCEDLWFSEEDGIVNLVMLELDSGERVHYLDNQINEVTP